MTFDYDAPASTEEYAFVLATAFDTFSSEEQKLLRILYELPDHSSGFKDLALRMGYSEPASIVVHCYRLARKFSDRLGGEPPEKGADGRPVWFSFVAKGTLDRRGRTWTLYPEVVEAIEQVGVFSHEE